ncbi:hypothetical protein [Fibrobacter sp. UWB12]|uniref:hypothetical protein n=1 Tax=Fibrobacter sp. UWB12 TaxID=1896203 RepID=UPI000916FE39|nr:hypothetical protein [Fibrobacter sp. UWB12]SHK39942.1 hypothetical protein SAMN05720759_102292 [Fibrobacter sp. UWB12]
MKKLITILALGLASILHAGEDSFAFRNDSLAVANDISFSHLSVFLEGGEIYPMGDLMDAVKNTLYGGVGIHYTYWENVDGIVMFQYAYFKPRTDIYYYGVHQFMGRVGADWKWKTIQPVVLGAGFSCSWTRADAEETFANKRGGTLTDNETEFGWYARISLPVFKYKEYRAGFHVMWEQLWTLPKRSNMLYAGLTFERSIW